MYKHIISVTILSLIAGVLAVVTPASAVTSGVDSLFGNMTTNVYDKDTASYEIGIRFTPRVSGTISHVRYYRVARCEYGTMTGFLYQGSAYSGNAKKIATTLSTNVKSSNSSIGWQILKFSTPVNITAGVEYTVARTNPHGCNGRIVNAFVSPTVIGSFSLPASASVWRKTSNGTTGVSTTNYLTDFLFTANTVTAPTAPQNVSATSTNGGAVVSWNVPTSSGGSPITGYFVKYRLSSASTYTTVDAGNILSYTVGGLTNGMSYSIAVVAKNNVGVSPASPEVVVVPSTRTVTPEMFGAKGDGITDDTDAIQKSINSLASGDTLMFTSGKTYAYSKTSTYYYPGWNLTVGRPNVRITGGSGATLLATSELTSAFAIKANNVTVDNLVFKTASTTKRWAEYEKMGLRLGTHSGIVVTDVTVDGPGAAGVYVGGSSQFSLTRVNVKNTRSDGIHISEGSHDGVLSDCSVTNSGDDGFAIVSYKNDANDVYNIVNNNPKFFGQTHGRGFSVVGGHNITVNNVYAKSSDAAGIYVAAESEWNTYPVSNVVFDGGVINNANMNTSVDHGGILVYNSQSGTVNTDVVFKNLKIYDTRISASRNIGVINNGGVNQRLSYQNIIVTGGPSTVFWSNTTSGAYNVTGLTVNGVVMPDRLGWQ